MSAPVFSIERLDKHFGGLHVTQGVSLALHTGERVALIGPNGAGKTTLINLISGVLRPDAGRVQLHGEDVTHQSQAARVRAGLVRTFQLTTLAQHLPVQRQIELALFEREGLSSRLWYSMDTYPALTQEALAILEALGLLAFAGLPTEALAYGEQRLVEMGLALALKPKVLLLDEPTATMDDAQERQCLGVLAQEAQAGKGMVIVTHKSTVLPLVTRLLVMVGNSIVLDGPRDEILQKLNQTMAA